MPLGRSLIPLAALSLILAGCASMQNTVAQDLAEERVRACNHIQGINITRVEPNGRVWATYMADHRSAFNAWNQCMQQAAADQAQRKTATVAPPPAVVAASTAGTPSDSINSVPVWKPGYEWAFSVREPSRKWHLCLVNGSRGGD